MRIIDTRTGNVIEVTTGKHGNKDEQARAAKLIRQRVRCVFTAASRQRAKEFYNAAA